MTHMFYSITISPRYRASTPIFLFNSDEPMIRRYLNKFSRYYIIYPEFDDKVRLHYHGILRVHDMLKYRCIKHTMDRMIGFTCIKKINTFNDKLKWLIYCQKQWASNIHLFEKPIIYRRLKRKRVVPKEEKKNILDYF